MLFTIPVDASSCVPNLFGVESIAQLLRRIRGQMPMERAAQEAGITKDAWWRIETGKTLSPRYDTLEGIANAFGIGIDQLAAAIRIELANRPNALGNSPSSAITQGAIAEMRAMYEAKLAAKEEVLRIAAEEAKAAAERHPGDDRLKSLADELGSGKAPARSVFTEPALEGKRKGKGRKAKGA